MRIFIKTVAVAAALACSAVAAQADQQGSTEAGYSGIYGDVYAQYGGDYYGGYRYGGYNYGRGVYRRW